MSWVILADTVGGIDEKELAAFNKAREMLGTEAYVSNVENHFEVGVTDAEGNHPVGEGASWEEAFSEAENNTRLVDEIGEDEINKRLQAVKDTHGIWKDLPSERIEELMGE